MFYKSVNSCMLMKLTTNGNIKQGLLSNFHFIFINSLITMILFYQLGLSPVDKEAEQGGNSRLFSLYLGYIRSDLSPLAAISSYLLVYIIITLVLVSVLLHSDMMS